MCIEEADVEQFMSQLFMCQQLQRLTLAMSNSLSSYMVGCYLRYYGQAYRFLIIIIIATDSHEIYETKRQRRERRRKDQILYLQIGMKR